MRFLSRNGKHDTGPIRVSVPGTKSEGLSLHSQTIVRCCHGEAPGSERDMKRIMYSVLLVIGLLVTPALTTAAQPAKTDQQYTSVITGEDLDLGENIDITFLPDEFELNESDTFREEFVWFTYNWSNFQVAFVEGPVTSSQYHDVTMENMVGFYENFEVVDEDIRRDGSWFVARAEYNGEPLVIYYEYHLDVIDDVDLLVMQFTEEITFVSDLEVVQSEVTVGGESILPNTDLDMLAGLIGDQPAGTATGEGTEGTETSSGRTTRTSRTSGTEENASTPESEEGEDEGTSGRTTRTSRTTSTEGTEENTTETTGSTDRGSLNIPSGLGGDGDVSTPETGNTDTGTDAADWESLGLVLESEWVSPSVGTTISWDTVTWEFPRDYESAIYIGEDGTYDVITLQTTDGLGYIFVTVEGAGDYTPRDLVSYWTSPDYAATFEKDITVLDSSSTATTASVVYETTNARDQSLVVVVEASFLEDGTIVFSQISAAPETIHDVYGQAITGIEANGAPLEATWTVEDIQEITGN